jgi:MFS family permease
VTGYSLVGAAVIVTSGALGDVLGRRKVFLAGLALFVGSCGRACSGSTAIAAACVPLTLATVAESRDPTRSSSIDFAKSILVALILAPVVLALSKGNDWGWVSAATLGCFAVSIVSTVLFVHVERRASAPLVDLRLLRNRVLVGATLAILIVAGSINAIMYVLSLYFQDPAGLDQRGHQQPPGDRGVGRRRPGGRLVELGARDGDLVGRRHRAHRAHGPSAPAAHPRDRPRGRGSRERAHDPDRTVGRLVTSLIRNRERNGHAG